MSSISRHQSCGHTGAGWSHRLRSHHSACRVEPAVVPSDQFDHDRSCELSGQQEVVEARWPMVARVMSRPMPPAAMTPASTRIRCRSGSGSRAVSSHPGHTPPSSSP